MAKESIKNKMGEIVDGCNGNEGVNEGTDRDKDRC